jgi:anti-sigma B factor antagonist
MELRLTSEANVVVVAPAGRLTGAADAARLFEAIERLLGQGRKSYLFDLQEVSWVDSTGIGALVSIFEMVRRHGGATRFAGLNDRLARIMEITKLDRVLEIYPTRNEALEAFGGVDARPLEESAPSDSSPAEDSSMSEETDETSPRVEPPEEDGAR